ncbi:MAG: ABC transporter permease [Planctomycetaceae bacterium]|nr:ABC transporter permease [Planctomycetaceae bacterium]
MNSMTKQGGAGRFVLDYFAYITLFVAVIFFSAVNSDYLSLGNLREILMWASITTPIALGIMLTLGLRGIDMSPGTTVGLTGIVMALMIQAKYGLASAILVGCLIGLAVGALNAVLVARFNLEPLIATLSMMFIGSSIERALTRGGLPIYLYGEKVGLGKIFRTDILSIPLPIWFLVVLTCVFYLVLDKTAYGRKFYASGASLRGSVNAGISIRTYIAGAYIISGLTAALAGVLVASQVRSGQPLVGQSFLWDSIGAAFISRFLSRRDRPNALGTAFGAILFASIHVGLTLVGVQFYLRNFFLGLIILIILLAASLRSR